MAKRFAATEIWEEDWFIDLPNEYKLFWFYMLATCDQAGFFKVNIKMFCVSNNVSIDSETAMDLYNKGKKRIRKVNSGLWLVEDFFSFQYGQRFNKNNPMHAGIGKIFTRNGVEISSIRGISIVSEGSGEGLKSVRRVS
jgi:hypothetical protein